MLCFQAMNRWNNNQSRKQRQIEKCAPEGKQQFKIHPNQRITILTGKIVQQRMTNEALCKICDTWLNGVCWLTLRILINYLDEENNISVSGALSQINFKKRENLFFFFFFFWRLGGNFSQHTFSKVFSFDLLRPSQRDIKLRTNLESRVIYLSLFLWSRRYIYYIYYFRFLP